MKVVLFCGGLGTRLREHSDTIPKPLVDIGYRPILWHLMRYYAHFGHTEFILSLGYRGDLIKKYFLRYDECLSNDFILSEGGQKIELQSSDIKDWRITFVDTGIQTNIGGRLAKVRGYLGNDETFLASYSDALTNVDLDDYVRKFNESGKVGALLAVQPMHSFHTVHVSEESVVTDLRPSHDSGFWINGGFFVFRRSIFDYMRDGEELVEEPFRRLVAEGQLMAYRYRGYWDCIDTFKDKKRFDSLFASGTHPWAIWDGGNSLGREATE